LGIPVSHGCVRVGIGPAENVYNFATIGTKVVIHQ
jgi:lipoprotein-anchoring transpeptidase ErfK/SrfK